MYKEFSVMTDFGVKKPSQWDLKEQSERNDKQQK